MKIKNAVIPVAGLGTRLLPATKSQPKEMLPVGKKPVVQYVVEELEQAGVIRMLFVTGRNKRSIEDHFDRDNELLRALETSDRTELLEELEFELMEVRFLFTRQSEQKGLGHAIAHAEDFSGTEPFVVALGDTLIRDSQRPTVVERLIDCYRNTDASCVIAFDEVPREETVHFGIARPATEGDTFEVADVIEKPSVDEAPSNLAIASRYVFSPSIFGALRQTKPGKNGEIQLTDAIRILMSNGLKVYGVKLHEGERRYDIGSYQSYFRGFVDFALDDPVHGPPLREYLLTHPALK